MCIAAFRQDCYPLQNGEHRACACSAYILKLSDVIGHLFGVETFARFAGTRTHALLDSEFYHHVDYAHGGAISALSEDPCSEQKDEHTNDVPCAAINMACAPVRVADQLPPSEEVASDRSCSQDPCSRTSHDSQPDEVTADPSDEVMTALADTITLFFALFVDGVQLHAHGRATTTVVGLKCLDLPGFLCNTDIACYPLAFVGGPKEPSNLAEIMAIILQQFKDHEPGGCVDEKGMALTVASSSSA